MKKVHRRLRIDLLSCGPISLSAEDTLALPANRRDGFQRLSA
jgi:hypothetical protein